MTTKTWNGSTNDWYSDSGADWNPTGDPAATDDVMVGGGTITLTSGDAGISVSSITLSGSGVLEIEDPGVTQSVTGNVAVSGSADLLVDNGGNGGSTLTIGGTLTNSSFVQIGNGFVAGTISAQGLANTGRIDIDGASAALATLDITGAVAPATWTGTVNVSSKGLLEFAGSSQIGTVAGGAAINLYGPQAYIADAGINTTSDSALTQLANVAGQLALQDGASLTTTTGLSNSGNLLVDNGGSGGSTLTIGGTLSNSGFVQIGNDYVAGTIGAQGLANSGRIDIDGASAAQATLDIGAAAPASWTGTVNVSSEGLLEFAGTSQIGTIASGAQINLFGPQAYVADAGIGTTSDSALTPLANVAGQLALQDGASLTTTTGLSNSGNLLVDNGGSGGSTLTIGGTLSNSGFVQIGNDYVAGTVNAQGLANTGRIDIDGASAALATLDITGAVAPATWTGTVNVSSKGLLEFAGSSQIGTVAGGAAINLYGPQAYIADAGINTTSDSALTQLANVAGQLALQDGASLTTTTGLSNSGNLLVDNGGSGGSTLTIGGTLSNSGFVQIGNDYVAGTIGAQGLANSGRIDIDGASAAQATLDIGAAAPASWTGTVNVSSEGLLEFAGTSQIGTIASGAQINLFGPQAYVADAGIGTTSDSALTPLANVAGQLALQDGASLTTTTGLSNSGNLLVDNGGNGGSTLTIGGTLSNSGFVQIGNDYVAGTVNAQGLANSGRIDIDGASAGTQTATLTINAAAINSATVNINGDSELAANPLAAPVLVSCFQRTS